ncbi:NADH:flavin oxidoreductase/NADH oxidase [Agrobacterium tumefaciens]|nr:NADH:flavin oxidoreductase/NADH oxidase [Agrobacterium tumefaciens]
MGSREIETSAMDREALTLLSPITIRGLTLKNRIAISPMCMYSATNGIADDFHLVHLGRFALGGAGLVFVEATAVSERGRITHGCLGLWNEDQQKSFSKITSFLHGAGAAAGIQLSHAGHKGSSQRPWHGGGPLSAADVELRGEDAWEPLGAVAQPFDKGWATPAQMSSKDIEETISAFVAAVRRADDAGFDVVEIHCAHGYLLHSFLSPLSNHRLDEYGGDLQGRMRFPLDVLKAVRDAWPSSKPLFVRISSVDGINVGWSIEDSVQFSRAAKEIGVDLIDCSSGGMKLEKHQNLLAREPGFHLPYSEHIKREVDILTIAVGLIRSAGQANDIIALGQADLVSIAREALFNPNWPNETALKLEGAAAWSRWPEQFGWWLMRRARQQNDQY